jgi:DNA-directed RNA polymerase I, II, and III subunit RPABC1
MTPFATKEMGMEGDAMPQIDVFKKAQLAFNVTKHNLVPRHVPLSVLEKKKLLQRLNCKAHSLPKIKADDPVVHYSGLPIGTVIAIERTFGALETESYYRLVV